jgi:hypothetical protein
MKAGIVPLILGSPGIGKSEGIKALGRKHGYHVITRMPSQHQPSDFVVPWVDGVAELLRYYIADWLKGIDPKTPTILFLDEITNASREMQTVLLGLLLDKTLGGHQLPENCYIIAAGNLLGDYALVEDEINSALASRVNIMVVDSSASDWLKWAQQNEIHPMIVDFIKTSPQFLYGKNIAHHIINPTPRSWVQVSNILKAKYSNSSDEIICLIQGILGLETAQAFASNLTARSKPLDLDIMSQTDDPKVLARYMSETTLQAWNLIYALNSWVTDYDSGIIAMKLVVQLIVKSPHLDGNTLELGGTGLVVLLPHINKISPAEQATRRKANPKLKTYWDTYLAPFIPTIEPTKLD